MAQNKFGEKSQREMKPTAFSLKLRAVMVLVMLAGGAQTILSAQSNNASQNGIVGVWDVQVTVLNCSDGSPLAAFRGLHKYELGGTAQVVPGTNPAALSSHVGVWSNVSKDKYQLNFKMFRFDGAGNNIGWIVVKNKVAINKDATSYASLGLAETFDSSGNSLGTTCPTFTGTRFQ